MTGWCADSATATSVAGGARPNLHLASAMHGGRQSTCSSRLRWPRVHAVTAARKDQSDGQSPSATSGQTACSRCGGDHWAAVCRFKEADCRRCGKKEHIARGCRSKEKTRQQRRGPGRRHQAHVLGIEEREPEPEYSLFNLSSRDRGAYNHCGYIDAGLPGRAIVGGGCGSVRVGDQ